MIQTTIDWTDRYHDPAKYRVYCAKTHQKTGGVCVVCMSNRSQQIHHSSYRKSGDRPLVNTFPVCLRCHQTVCHSKENWIYNPKDPKWKNKNTASFVKQLQANAKKLQARLSKKC